MVFLYVASLLQLIPGKTSAQTFVTLALPPHPLNLHHHPAPVPLHSAPQQPLQHTALSTPTPQFYSRPVAAVSPNPPAAISTKAIEKFREECIQVLSTIPDSKSGGHNIILRLSFEALWSSHAVWLIMAPRNCCSLLQDPILLAVSCSSFV